MSHIQKTLMIALLACLPISLINAAPITVYNQAYIENHQADKVADIKNQAKNAYILLDPDQENIAQLIKDLKANNNQVGAYISIGTAEAWRSDFAQMQPHLVKQAWQQWHNEYFISEVAEAIYDVMQTRIDRLGFLEFDWVEFDNMDWAFDDKLRKKYGFLVTKDQSISYFQEQCDYVHQYDMKCMAKNMPEHIDLFDGITFESYEDDKNWWDVDAAKKIATSGKLFIIVHYGSTNCATVYKEYLAIYGDQVSFICEDTNQKQYIHYNQ